MKNLFNFINNKILKNKKLLTICVSCVCLFVCLPSNLNAGGPNIDLSLLYMIPLSLISFISLILLVVGILMKNQTLLFIVSLVNSFLAMIVFPLSELPSYILRDISNFKYFLPFSEKFFLSFLPIIFCLVGIIVPLFFVKNKKCLVIVLALLLVAMSITIYKCWWIVKDKTDHYQVQSIKRTINAQRYDKLEKIVSKGVPFEALLYIVSTNNKEIIDLTLPKVSQREKDLVLEYVLSNEYDNYETIEAIISAGANVNFKISLGGNYISEDSDDNVTSTPLITAVRNGKKDIVELLINKGAEINLKEYAGRTALDFAKDDEMKQLLISHGAKSGKDLK